METETEMPSDFMAPGRINNGEVWQSPNYQRAVILYIPDVGIDAWCLLSQPCRSRFGGTACIVANLWWPHDGWYVTRERLADLLTEHGWKKIDEQLALVPIERE